MDKPTDGPWHTWFDPFSHCWRIDHKIPDNSIIVAIGVGKESDARLICQAPALAAEVERLRDALQKIADMERFTFAECSDAEFIISTAKAALARQEAP